MIELKVKKLNEEAVIPKYAKEGDACFDLTAISVRRTNIFIEFGTGLAMEIPEGYVGLIFPRSSITKKDIMLKNSVGVIDSGYRGEIKFRFIKSKHTDDGSVFYQSYKEGDRVGQMMIIERPFVNIKVVDELNTSERGKGGYGSTGE